MRLRGSWCANLSCTDPWQRGTKAGLRKVFDVCMPMGRTWAWGPAFEFPWHGLLVCAELAVLEHRISIKSMTRHSSELNPGGRCTRSVNNLTIKNPPSLVDLHQKKLPATIQQASIIIPIAMADSLLSNAPKSIHHLSNNTMTHWYLSPQLLPLPPPTPAKATSPLPSYKNGLKVRPPPLSTFTPFLHPYPLRPNQITHQPWPSPADSAAPPPCTNGTLAPPSSTPTPAIATEPLAHHRADMATRGRAVVGWVVRAGVGWGRSMGGLAMRRRIRGRWGILGGIV